MSATFSWESVDPSVVAVSATGEITAVGEGSTDIIVTLAGTDIQTQISVVTKNKVYLESIKISSASLEMRLGGTDRLIATAEPAYIITVPYDELTWTSSNPSVVTVNQFGDVTAVGRGRAKIIVSSGNIKSETDVLVYEIQTPDRSAFSIAGVSDQTEWDGGGVNVILEQFEPYLVQDRFWHSMWHDGNAPLPHWVVIDMGKERTVASVAVYRRFGNTDTKTVRSYVGNDPNANASTWEFFGENQFPGYWGWDWGNVGGTFWFLSATHSVAELKNMKKGRYLKIVLPDSYREPFTSLSQVRITEVVE
jgi:hypothetical protein